MNWPAVVLGVDSSSRNFDLAGWGLISMVTDSLSGLTVVGLLLAVSLLDGIMTVTCDGDCVWSLSMVVLGCLGNSSSDHIL